MIHKSSEYGFRHIVDDILSEPLRFILFNDDCEKSLLLRLESETKYNEKQILEDDKNKVCVYVIPIRYMNNEIDGIDHRIDCRDFAMDLLYDRWCKLNDKPKKKAACLSGAFTSYLEDAGFYCSDFIVVAVD